jgi:hypothetical protein
VQLEKKFMDMVKQVQGSTGMQQLLNLKFEMRLTSIVASNRARMDVDVAGDREQMGTGESDVEENSVAEILEENIVPASTENDGTSSDDQEVTEVKRGKQKEVYKFLDSYVFVWPEYSSEGSATQEICSTSRWGKFSFVANATSGKRHGSLCYSLRLSRAVISFNKPIHRIPRSIAISTHCLSRTIVSPDPPINYAQSSSRQSSLCYPLRLSKAVISFNKPIHRIPRSIAISTCCLSRTIVSPDPPINYAQSLSTSTSTSSRQGTNLWTEYRRISQ